MSTINWSKIGQPDFVFQRFPSRRSVIYGTKGMVSSSQPLATEAGLEILRKGGNAADAAVAVAAALNVTEPSSCGIGGDAFCLFYDANTKVVKALNGSGRSPAKLDLKFARELGYKDKIPPTDVNSVTVPGAAAAWVDTVQKLGNGKVTLAQVLEPAIRLAEEGVPVSEINSCAWQRAEDTIKDASPNGNEMLLNGKAPLPGEVIKLPNLAKTFREVAMHGKDGFYKGRVAQAIIDLIQSKGGVMELEDLANHETDFVEPIKYTYMNEVTVYECPPNGQGITALIALGILDSLQEQGIIKPLLEMEHNSPEYLHVLIEALRKWYVADPDVRHVPVKGLLSKDYLASRAKLIDPRRANPEAVHGNPVYSSDTVYFSVTDRWGNACSFIQSNYGGRPAIPKGCGFTLQNRGSGFVLQENHPNVLEGAKRPYHTIIPSLATRKDDLFLCFGVMGGYMQVRGFWYAVYCSDEAYSPKAALDAPRFCISAALPEFAKSFNSTGDVNSEVYFEDTFLPETVVKLREMGHDVQVLTGFDRSMMGRGQVIQKINNASGKFVWAAGSDPRADGHASAQI
ncbi:gamma-glutamyltranspeptidase [Amanita rubescens]|nr:gamma-glutamyltranspeptidase [Amanita rubescens]